MELSISHVIGDLVFARHGTGHRAGPRSRGFHLSPLRRYWCIPVPSRSWASGSSSVSAQLSDVAPATVRGRNGCGELSRASKMPTARCACIFSSPSTCSLLGSCDSRCSVRSLVLSLFSPRGAGSTVLPSLLGIATHVLVWVPGGPSLALVRGDALAARVEICTEAGFAGLGNGPILVSFAAQPCSFHGPQFFFVPQTALALSRSSVCTQGSLRLLW